MDFSLQACLRKWTRTIACTARRLVQGSRLKLCSCTWRARDLAHFTPPLYQADPADSSGSKPGAVIEINQNADAVKFSIEADITDKDIKQTAQRISAELVKRINAAVKSEDEQLNKYAKP